MLLLAFAVYIPIFSIMGADSLKDFILPALALAIPMAAGNIRVFRSSLLDGYNSDFVLYARARGVSEWKIANLVSRFALPPLITMLAQSFGFMIAGSAMVESVFSIPGLGSMLSLRWEPEIPLPSMRVYCSPPSFSSWSILSRTA